MWEFSITLDGENVKAAKFLYKEIKKSSFYFQNVLTTYKEDEKVHIVIACDEIEKSRASFFIMDAISETICTHFKYKYIDSNLSIPISNKVNLNAFKKALVSFDKETDKYLVNKLLELENNIYIESFFNFKLRSLKSKWLELVKLANDNASYLLCNDTFVELLKFLVDNLEISNSVINVIREGESYKICDEFFNEIEDQNEELKETDEDIFLITSLIALCPKKINVYCDTYVNSNALTLISQIFESRLHIMPIAEMRDKGHGSLF